MASLRAKLATARRFRGGAATAKPFANRCQLLGYISGFVSAEGSFGLASGHPTFGVHLRHDDRPLLELLAATTGLGAVRDHKPYPPMAPNPSSSWTITATAELVCLLDLLSEARLAGRKRLEMETWAVAVDEIDSSRRLGIRPRRELVRLAGAQLRSVREYRPSARSELLRLPGREMRVECLTALDTWARTTNGSLACGGYSRWRRDHPSAPTRNTIARTFGGWYAAMEAAGLADRAARRGVRPIGGEARRRAVREQQRARVVDAVRRFEAEHGRLPRAMEFFRWRFAAAPDSPTQATVYHLFPGGWAAVLEACRASYRLG